MSSAAMDPTPPPGPVAAVVLAGGESRRFGSDKLRHVIGDRPLLELASSGLPEGSQVILVGSEVRGGPAAGMVAGLRAALAGGAELMAVLPGDAPRAGRLAAQMLVRLGAEPDLCGLVAVDAQGDAHPLQLALRRPAVQMLIDGAGATAGVDARARDLVSPLALESYPASAWDLFDIDTPEQLADWERG